MRDFFHRKSTYLIGIPVLLVVIALGGAWFYTRVISPPAKKVGFSDITTTTAASSTPTTTLSSAQLDGTWKPTNASVVQYLVPETLFGQSTRADGKTRTVTGTLTLAGTTVPKVDLTVDLTTVTSDRASRDRQFQGRIMDTAEFPTATFELTKPIVLGAIPAEHTTIAAPATGNLMLRGNTKSVSFEVQARRVGNTIEVKGSIPIHFPDYRIPNPTFGPAAVGDNGQLAFALAFEKA